MIIYKRKVDCAAGYYTSAKEHCQLPVIGQGGTVRWRLPRMCPSLMTVVG